MTLNLLQSAGHQIAKCLIVFVFAVTSMTPAFAVTGTSADAKTTDATGDGSTDRVQSILDYENQFATLGGLLDELYASGSINTDEKNGIDTFLAEQKVDRSMSIHPGTANGKTLQWGHVALTLELDGSGKTQSGRVLHPTAGQAKDKIFIETFNALREKTADARGWNRLMIDSAYADSLNPVDDFVGGVLGGIARTIASVFAVVSIVACGLIAVPIDFALSVLREAVWNNTVECRDGHFMRVTYPKETRFDGQVRKDYRIARNATPGFTLSKDLDAAAFAACGGPIGRLIPGTPLSRAKYTPIPAHVLAKGLPPDMKHRPCSNESAAKMTQYISDQGRSVENAIIRGAKQTQDPAQDQRQMINERDQYMIDHQRTNR